MEIAKIDVSGVRARAIVYKPIPMGIVGGTVRFAFSDHMWDGLTKTVVFQAGDVTKDVANPGELVTIPPEITRQVRRNVLVGVYGTDSQQNLVIPTLWATIGMVRDATSPSGDTSTDESLPVWAQLQGMIGNLDELDTEAKNNLVAAINEAMTKGGGGGEVDPAEIQRIVDEYLAAHPPAPGEDGKSAYEIAVENGYLGTQAQWLESLQGEQGPHGDTGPQGPAGYTPVKGTDYFTAADKAELVDSVLAALPAAEGVHY